MKLNAPYYSQRMDVKDPFWRKRACGIVSLKMAMDYLATTWRPDRQAGYKRRSADFLIKKGLKYGAYLKDVGWIHDGLVKIAKAHGFKKSFRKEWDIAVPQNKNVKIKNQNDNSKFKINPALNYILDLLKNSVPVLASIRRGRGGHLVLLTGFKKNGKTLRGFYFHDPNCGSRAIGRHKFIKIVDFLKIWKGRIVVVKK